MGCISISLSLIPFPALNYTHFSSLPTPPKPLISGSQYPSKRQFRFSIRKGSPPPRNCFSDEIEVDSQSTVEVLRVPNYWLEPSKALQESEWLRLALHKWLDDEYCPEPTNVDISRIAADSYYQSLLQKTADLGEILLKMVRELETISYQESFHGAFSSANAAVSLIAQRIEEED